MFNAMIVIKEIKDIGETFKVPYPAKWGNEIINLDDNIEFYEIQNGEKPVFNSNQFDLIETITLTEFKGDFLNIAEIEYSLKEKRQDEIIDFLNNSVGSWIDTQYPFWEQNKHSGKALRALNKMMLGETLTLDEQAYIDYVQACADWASECRALRDDFEYVYTTEGTLPDIVFSNKPAR